MKNLFITLRIFFLVLMMFLPILVLAGEANKTDIKAVSNSTVSNIEGQPLQLGTTWKEKPVVLVFVRHFGWLLCREQVAQLRDKVDEIHKAGAELIIIGNGNANFANAFQKKLNLTTPLYVDPSLTVYNAAGLKRTKAGTIGPRNWLPALKALFTGNFQGRTQGDPYQQGGAFIIFPGDKLIYSYISKRPSDRPPAKKIVEKLKAEQQKLSTQK